MDQNEGRETTPEGYDERQKAAYLEGIKTGELRGRRIRQSDAPFDVTTSALSGAGLAVVAISWSHNLSLFGLGLALAMAGIAVGNAHPLIKNLQNNASVTETTREILMLGACLTVIAAALAPGPATTAICLLSIGALLVNEVRNRFKGSKDRHGGNREQDDEEGG